MRLSRTGEQRKHRATPQDGVGTEALNASCRVKNQDWTWPRFPALTWWLNYLYCSSRGSDTIFWPPWTLHTHGTLTHTQRQNTHNEMKKKLQTRKKPSKSFMQKLDSGVNVIVMHSSPVPQGEMTKHLY